MGIWHTHIRAIGNSSCQTPQVGEVQPGRDNTVTMGGPAGQCHPLVSLVFSGSKGVIRFSCTALDCTRTLKGTEKLLLGQASVAANSHVSHTVFAAASGAVECSMRKRRRGAVRSSTRKSDSSPQGHRTPGHSSDEPRCTWKYANRRILSTVYLVRPELARAL